MANSASVHNAGKAIMAMKVKHRSRRNAGEGVPFDEMCRLMRVYGPIKCLRNRQVAGSDGQGRPQIDSVKRKFYRWFPDLDERFEKDHSGLYRPRAGHQLEIRYRELMRARGGEIISKKRSERRKQTLGLINEKAKVKAKIAESQATLVAPCPPTPHETIIRHSQWQEESCGVKPDTRVNFYSDVMASNLLLMFGKQARVDSSHPVTPV